MVTIISDELLKDLNNGKVIDIEISGLGFSLASEKWAKKQEEYLEKSKKKINNKFREEIKKINNEFREEMRRIKND